MNILPNPKTNTQELLYTLIVKGEVSIFDFPYLSGFRTRVSDLKIKHKLPLTSRMFVKVNKFDNEYRYAVHYLKKEDKEKAIELYKTISR